MPLDAMAIICAFADPPCKLSMLMSCKALLADFTNPLLDDRLWQVLLNVVTRAFSCLLSPPALRLFFNSSCGVRTPSSDGALAVYADVQVQDSWSSPHFVLLSLPSNYRTHRTFALSLWAIAAARRWQVSEAPAASLLNKPEQLWSGAVQVDDEDCFWSGSGCAGAIGLLNTAWEECVERMYEPHRQEQEGYASWTWIGEIPFMDCADPAVAGAIFELAEGETVALLQRSIYTAIVPFGHSDHSEVLAEDIVITWTALRNTAVVSEHHEGTEIDLPSVWRCREIVALHSAKWGAATRLVRALCRRAGLIQITGDAMNLVFCILLRSIRKIGDDLLVQATSLFLREDETGEGSRGGTMDDESSEDEDEDEDEDSGEDEEIEDWEIAEDIENRRGGEYEYPPGCWNGDGEPRRIYGEVVRVLKVAPRHFEVGFRPNYQRVRRLLRSRLYI